MDLQIKSLLALFNVLVGFLVSLRGGYPTGWGEAIVYALDCFKAAYPDQNTRPKNHMALHLDDVLKKWGFIPTCFACERKHKQYKLLSGPVCSMAGFDKSMAMNLINSQVRDLQGGSALGEKFALINPSAARSSIIELLGGRRVLAARVARHGLHTTAVGDIVYTAPGYVVAEIQQHLWVDPPIESAHFVCLAEPFRKTDAGLYRRSGELVLLASECIIRSAVWRPVDHSIEILELPEMSYIGRTDA